MRKIDLFSLILICFGLFSCGGGYDGPVHFIISGQVTFNGEGYGGATVRLTDDLDGSRLVGAAITDEKGEYAFTGLSNGTYTVTVLVEGQKVDPVSIAEIVIARDDSFGHDFSLVTHTVSGRVTREGGGYPGALVTLFDHAVASTLSTVTPDSGDYAFSGLLNGDYTVTPSSSVDTFNPLFRDVAVNDYDETDQDFVVVLPDTYAISGTVDLNDAENDWVTLTLTSGAATVDTTTPDASGHYSFANLPSGAYTVTPSSEYGTFEEGPQPATITDSNIPNVNFTFTPYTYSISGIVTLYGGDPGGITLTLRRDTTIVASSSLEDSSGAYSFPGLLPGEYTVTPSSTEGTFDPTSWTGTIPSINGGFEDVNFIFNPYNITDLTITGPTFVGEGDTAGYTATASWEDGSETDVTTSATWSEDSDYATIDMGVLTTNLVPSNQVITITASYTYGGVTFSDTHSVTIVNSGNILTGLTITGATSVNESSTANYTATASWDDGTTTNVTTSATWGEDSDYATITGGVLTTDSVETDQEVTITSEFAHEGVTQSDTFAVTILDIM